MDNRTYEALDLVHMIDVLNAAKKLNKTEVKLKECIAEWRGLSIDESSFGLKDDEITELLVLADLIGMKGCEEYF